MLNPPSSGKRSTSSSPSVLAQSKFHLGRSYEDRAAEFLKHQGLTLLERNIYFRVGEIDLIFQDSDVLVFVEVRFRAEAGREDPLMSLNFGKKRRLRLAIERYLQENGRRYQRLGLREVRVDVVGFRSLGDPIWVRSIQI